MDFLKIETEEDELFFEGPDPEPVPPASPPARKKVSRGKATAAVAEEAAAATIADPEPVPTVDAAVVAAEAQPAIIVRQSRLPMIAVALAALAALFAAIGLLMTLNAMARLDAERIEVEQRETALARLPALLAEVQALVTRQREELERAARHRPADIVTGAELSRQLAELRFGLSRMQAPGTAALAGVVRAGQNELAGRIEELADRVDAVDMPRKASAPAAH